MRSSWAVAVLCVACSSGESPNAVAKREAAERTVEAESKADQERDALKKSRIDSLNELREARGSTPYDEADRLAHNFCTVLTKAQGAGVTVKSAAKGEAFCAEAKKLRKAAEEPARAEYTEAIRAYGPARAEWSKAGPAAKKAAEAHRERVADARLAFVKRVAEGL